jgi:beta-galactosidase
MTNNVSFPGNVFPYGTHVYREPHADMDEIMADLPLLKKLGFNMIKIQESWAIDEPKEGQIDLSNIEKIIAKADHLNLGVYLGLTMEQAPAWMWRKYTDCHMVYADGRKCYDPTQYLLPNDGKPGPCWDHPGARKAGETFLTELTKKLSRFDNIWTWDAFSEIGFHWRPFTGNVLGFCYCSHTLNAFRQWLKEKYQSLENVNKNWRTAFGDWEEVEPPRRFAFTPIFIDWRYFMDNVHLSANLAWKTRILRQNDPMNRPVFSHVGGPYVGSAAEWRWAKEVDFYGNSNFPAWVPFHRWDDAYPKRDNKYVSYHAQLWDTMNFRADYCRCAGGLEKTFWGAEFQGGPISEFFHMGKDPDAQDIRRWVLAGLSAGMNGISFWNHRCELFGLEGNGFGLLDPEGDTTERIQEAGRIAKAIDKDPEIFSLGKAPRSSVAILINEDLYHYCQAIESFSVQGYTGFTARPSAAEHLEYTIRGNYYRLWQMGIVADFVEAEQVAEGELENYKVAIMPFPIALDGEYFSHIEMFIKQGGMLISEAIPGRFDKYGLCPRQQMVAGGREVFGAAHKSLQIVRQSKGKTLWEIEERCYGEFAPEAVFNGVGKLDGVKLWASLIKQTLSLTTAEPILMDNEEVVGTINSYGKGTAVLLGTVSGHSALTDKLDEPEDVFEKLMDSAGVNGDRCGQLLRRRRLLANKQAWFLTNHSENEIIETIDTVGFAKVRDLMGDSIINQSDAEVTIKVPPCNLCCLILE